MNFHVTIEEFKTIAEIADRAFKLAVELGDLYPLMDAEMDITATHANGCPLDLCELLAADDANFGHDVFGIRHFIDRGTGKLDECFLPRYARSPEEGECPTCQGRGCADCVNEDGGEDR